MHHDEEVIGVTDCPVSLAKSNTWSRFVSNRNTREPTGFAGFSLRRLSSQGPILPQQVSQDGECFKRFAGRTK